MHRIKGTDYVLELPEGSKLLVKERFLANPVNLDRCLVQTACMEFPARVIRLTLTVESKSQDAASASKSMRAVARTEARKKLESDSKGVVFSLDFRGHIEGWAMPYNPHL